MILPISWMYLAMMGADGLREATTAAITHANYIADRLSPYFTVLFRGTRQRVAHECILDIRTIKRQSGISAEDIAKRLIDYGFHAPTLSFPIAETLMIEPTESETWTEMERFITAMIAIHGEITQVIEGKADTMNNPLKNAPHHADWLYAETWPFPYSKQQAYTPLGETLVGKYWPPVSRVDNVYGDRNLVCACPPVAVYEDSA